MSDTSNGYEAIAREFIAGRGSGLCFSLGASNVREWSARIRPTGIRRVRHRYIAHHDRCVPREDEDGNHYYLSQRS